MDRIALRVFLHRLGQTRKRLSASLHRNPEKHPQQHKHPRGAVSGRQSVKRQQIVNRKRNRNTSRTRVSSGKLPNYVQNAISRVPCSECHGARPIIAVSGLVKRAVQDKRIEGVVPGSGAEASALLAWLGPSGLSRKQICADAIPRSGRDAAKRPRRRVATPLR